MLNLRNKYDKKKDVLMARQAHEEIGLQVYQSAEEIELLKKLLALSQESDVKIIEEKQNK